MEKTIKEGEITIIIDNGVFYNPDAEINRDLSVAALSAWIKREKPEKIKILDAFSGTGITGMRYAKECNNNIFVVLNDRCPKAARNIQENVQRNGLKNCEVSNNDCIQIMAKDHFTIIDIDPFGTPAPFLDAAVRSVWWKGLLMVTATDTAALNGSSPSAGLRKYGIFSGRTDFYIEFGLRALTTAIMLSCGRNGKAFFPLFCLAQKHYYRVIGRLSFRDKDITRMMDEIKMSSYCQKCGNRVIGIENACECGGRFSNYGPLFIGKIYDKEYCIDMMKYIACKPVTPKGIKELELLNKYIEEPEIDTPFYFDVHRLARLHHKNIKKMGDIISALKAAGFSAGYSAFCPTGIKTDAPLKEVVSNLD